MVDAPQTVTLSQAQVSRLLKQCQHKAEFSTGTEFSRSWDCDIDDPRYGRDARKIVEQWRQYRGNGVGIVLCANCARGLGLLW